MKKVWCIDCPCREYTEPGRLPGCTLGYEISSGIRADYDHPEGARFYPSNPCSDDCELEFIATKNGMFIPLERDSTNEKSYLPNVSMHELGLG